jgi:uncharacterized RDD family membrane protein YckC
MPEVGVGVCAMLGGRVSWHEDWVRRLLTNKTVLPVILVPVMVGLIRPCGMVDLVKQGVEIVRG